VSKATKRHCAGTEQSQGGRVGIVKQVGFEPRPEDSCGKCGSDKITQTVPLEDCSRLQAYADDRSLVLVSLLMVTSIVWSCGMQP